MQSQSYGHSGFRSWRSVVQRAMWPELIVFLPPGGNQYPGVMMRRGDQWHCHNRRFACRQREACRKGKIPQLNLWLRPHRSKDSYVWGHYYRQYNPKGLEYRARYFGERHGTSVSQDIHKYFWFHFVPSPCINDSMSWIGRHISSHSNARSFSRMDRAALSIAG